jgi:hypothetical protein
LSLNFYFEVLGWCRKLKYLLINVYVRQKWFLLNSEKIQGFHLCNYSMVSLKELNIKKNVSISISKFMLQAFEIHCVHSIREPGTSIKTLNTPWRYQVYILKFMLKACSKFHFVNRQIIYSNEEDWLRPSPWGNLEQA